MVGSLAAALLVVLPTTWAGAGAVPADRSGVVAAEAQVRAESGRIHLLTQQYAAAAAQVSSLSAQLRAEEQQLARLRRALAASHAALTRTAVDSYVDDSPSSALSASGGRANPAVKAEYLQIATDNVGTAIDAYELRERQVATTVSAVRGEEAAEQRVAQSEAMARRQALTVAAAEQRQLDSLESRLAAAEHAAAEHAAAARAAAARAAAGAQGGPVNGGLVDLVKSQTTADPTSTTATTSPPRRRRGGGGSAGGVWLQLRECESGDDYQADTGNGYYGAYQFSESTWKGLGYPGYPYQEPPAMQDAAARTLQAEYGWDQWPACAAALGLT